MESARVGGKVSEREEIDNILNRFFSASDPPALDR